MKPDSSFYCEKGMDNPMNAPRYCGIPTFMRTPFITDPSKLDIALVGDHSITLPILRSIAKEQPAGVIHIDAHTDCCYEEMNSKYSHGTP